MASPSVAANAYANLARIVDPAGAAAKTGDADPYAAARAYDTMMVIANGVNAAKTDAGPAVRDSIEKLPKGMKGIPGFPRL